MHMIHKPVGGLVPTLAFAFFFSPNLWAQPDTLPPRGGILFSQKKFAQAGKAELVVRSSHEGSDKNLLDQAGATAFNQRCESSCGACAVAKCMEIRYKIYCSADCRCSWPYRDLSWSFLHNQLVKKYGEANIYLKSVLDLAVNKGIALAKDFENTPCSHDQLPTAEKMQMAQNFKDWSFKPAFMPMRYIKGSKIHRTETFHKQKVPRTIAWLDRDVPVIVGIETTDNFRELKMPNCHWAPQGDNKWGHALLVVGYDDRNSHFLVLNSYGSDWGCSGTSTISYDDYSRVTVEAYVLEFNFKSGKAVNCAVGKK
jgi:Cysteine protease